MFTGFGLYVHIPYCLTKCPYCDFNVRAGRSWPETRYVEALRAEIEHAARIAPFAGKRLETIFVGGGTPSLFSPDSVERVLATARSLFETGDLLEVSLETTPDSIRTSTLAGYRQAGVNRLSIGIQSFQPRLLVAEVRKAAMTDQQQAVQHTPDQGSGVQEADRRHTRTVGLGRSQLSRLAKAFQLMYQPPFTLMVCPVI
jgi:oxygen-independent coproporphyrinogen-3 oxidase